MNHLSNDLVAECKERLITAKADILNQVQTHKMEFATREYGGDEVDQSVSILQENQFLASQQRLRQLLIEIEAALARIEKGQFGICEETLEPIEPDRLLALPWTRLSIEGAELREAVNTRFAR